MAEYIEREKLIEDVKNDCCELVYYTKADAIDCIKSAHAADVALVVHGRWEHTRQTIDTLGQTQCTNCGWWTLDPSVDGAYHYCPTCGAKMDLED